jgi:simple sugar transport system ATP-binding protein
MEGIHKYFGEVHALRGVDFAIGSNEVVGLIGDNGAGKSTLIKILSGVFPYTHGMMEIKDRVIKPSQYSVKRAHGMGIETVYQEQALGLKQSLWRNVFLGRQPTNRAGFIQMRKVRQQTEHIMRDFLGFTGGGITPESRVSTLSGGERQGVAIGRAMYFEADLIILDEPTRALSVKEVSKVLRFIRQVKERGKACVYISHTISDIYSVSDRFVIMDWGTVVGEYNQADISEKALTEELIHHSTTAELAGRGERTKTDRDNP